MTARCCASGSCCGMDIGCGLRKDVELACLDLAEQTSEQREFVARLAVRVVPAEPRVTAKYHIAHAFLPFDQHACSLELLVWTEMLKRWSEERVDFHNTHRVCTLERRGEEGVPHH
eukprot:scaffold7257_cov65-Phaeocystis_antarctica.AAC.12